jgi:hypothetical protein
MTKTKKHLKQLKCFHDNARFKFVLAGRRGGKTFMMVEDIIKTAHTMPPWSEIYYVGPTNQQAEELIWEPLEYRLEQQDWNFRALISKRRFELSRKRKIYVIGAEKHRRMRGKPIAKAYFDELAFWDADIMKVWRAVRPALTDYKGQCIAATTPDGKNTPAYEFYLDIAKKHNWKYYTWSSLDNPYLDPTEIEDARLELDEKSFRQEYEASWESFEGLAYYSFDESLHVMDTPKIRCEIPLILSFDFNVNPTSLLLSQWHDDAMYFKGEYSLKNASTEDTVIKFTRDYKDMAPNVRILIRGDAAGKSRSSPTGRTDYQVIEEILTAQGFRWERQVLGSNPPIVDRVKIVNSWLKPYGRKPRVYIDVSCKELIKDLSSQETNGRIPTDKGNLGHKNDALGYCIYYENRLKVITPVASRIL